ncbi:MAG TPA: class I SAM-dependent methyltransferase, partial [Thermoanaerobaculia bacterium]|nr:class I SAM-dependent methyltransferase [Thermoanaerobaculia bacterium]
TRSEERPWNEVLLRWTLVDTLPDASLALKAFSAHAAKVILGESKLSGPGSDLEIAFLANKYGFRVEWLHVHGDRPLNATHPMTALLAAVRIRLNERRMAYRAARRCPVCFSSEVWSCAQIPGNIVRACSRCKCRHLAEPMPSSDRTAPVRREIPAALIPGDQGDETQSVRTARERTSSRRLSALRRYLPPRARLLHIGVGDGSFGAAASREYEYVGIDGAPAAARAVRARGLEAYCATVANFVNTGPPFDAVVLFHVFEEMADPHDSLARIKDLLKPGGILLLTAFDTEGLYYLATERKRIAQHFHSRQILYSRSALIELLERSGFDIETIGPEFEYRDRKFLRHHLAARWPALAPLVIPTLKLLPNPLLISSGSVRVVARRRSGPPVNLRTVRSVEPTHAR